LPRKIAGAPITGPFLLPVSRQAGSTDRKNNVQTLPAAKDRWRADNRAISVTGFATSWIN
ncbi:hypothetical protein C2U36_27455, partial [Escherichia coli]